MELFRTTRPEAFARIVEVPDVEVTYLGAFWRAYSDNTAGFCGPGAAGADWESGLGHKFAWRGLDLGVDLFVD